MPKISWAAWVASQAPSPSRIRAQPALRRLSSARQIPARELGAMLAPPPPPLDLDIEFHSAMFAPAIHTASAPTMSFQLLAARSMPKAFLLALAAETMHSRPL